MRPRYADLLKRLNDPDPRKVDMAFDGILFDREQAVPDLLEGYTEPDLSDNVRFLMIQLLGFSECADAIPTVQKALEDPSPIVRAEACRSLADLRSRDSIPLLRKLTRDAVVDVRRAASDAISTLSRR